MNITEDVERFSEICRKVGRLEAIVDAYYTEKGSHLTTADRDVGDYIIELFNAKRGDSE